MIDNYTSTSRSLTIALLRARERIMRPFRAMLVDVGVTEQQWRVLRVLDDLGAHEPTRISQEACLLLPSLTRILQKLDEKDLITRHQDRNDGRKQVIQLSPNGKELIDSNRENSAAIINDVRERLGAEKFEHLIDLLNELQQI